MAKIGASIYTPNLMGRQGSSVFSKNKYGQYIKKFTAPSQPRTSPQLKRRAIVKLLTQQWQSLTDAQRLTWTSKSGNGLTGTYSTKSGLTVNLTGFNMFVEHNLVLSVCGAAYIKTAPDYFAGPIADATQCTVAFNLSPGSEDVTLTSPTLTTSQNILVKCTGIIAPGRKAEYSKAKILGSIDSTFISGASIKGMYLALYGTLPSSGSKVGFSFETINNTDGTKGTYYAMTAIASI